MRKVFKKLISFFIVICDGCGGFKSTVLTCDGLAATGYNLELVVLDKARSHNICPTEQASMRFLISQKYGCLKTYIKYFIELMKYLCQYKPAIITYSGSIKCFALLLAARFGARSSSRVILILRNTVSETPLVSKTLRRVRLFLLRVLIKKADVITVSSGIEKEIKQLCFKPRSLRTIYNPIVDFNVIGHQAQEGRNEMLHPFYSEKNSQCILAMGSLTPRKGFHVLVRAFAQLSKKNTHLRLIIVGEGPERERLEKLIQEYNVASRVALVGYQEKPVLWLSQADVFVLSSEEEGLPRVLVEAMACGLTPVSTDCKGDGAREILENGRYGYIVPVGDTDAMAQAILNALEKPLDPDLLRERASYFSVENSIKQYIDLIETCT